MVVISNRYANLISDTVEQRTPTWLESTPGCRSVSFSEPIPTV